MDPVRVTIHEQTGKDFSHAGMTFEIPLPPVQLWNGSDYWLNVRYALEMVRNVFGLGPPTYKYPYPPLDGEDAQLPF
jgi:hypothetical protein